MNPYQQVISVIGSTLEEFDDDKLIPAFGFGDTTTGDRACFPFHEGGKPSHGVAEVLERYEEIATVVDMAGPTSFAPVIREAIRIVQEERSYHILVIVADGQVTDASPQGETAQAIVEASHYPLSIVVVGVGDGPWNVMEEYDDELPERHFDNFQFVDYNAVVGATMCMHNHSTVSSHDQITARIEARFALAALMEVPDQFAFIKKAGLLSTSALDVPVRTARLAAPPKPKRPSNSGRRAIPATGVVNVNTQVPLHAPPSYQASVGGPYSGQKLQQSSRTSGRYAAVHMVSSWGTAPAAE